MIYRSLVFSSLLVASSSFAAPAPYAPVAQPNGLSGITFAIKYTLGTHNGSVKTADGELEIDPATLEISGGTIKFGIDAMTTGNDLRDCHLREALGINYTSATKGSYPDTEKACNENNTLPTSGPDSVTFPDVSLEFRAIEAGNLRAVLALHGIEKELVMPISVTAAPNGQLLVKSQFTIHLPDFGAIVKNGGPIKSANDATVQISLPVAPKK